MAGLKVERIAFPTIPLIPLMVQFGLMLKPKYFKPSKLLIISSALSLAVGFFIGQLTGVKSAFAADNDRDGLVNSVDPDDDNDSILDVNDAKSFDHDNDGQDDDKDDDDDNDEINDDEDDGDFDHDNDGLNDDEDADDNDQDDDTDSHEDSRQ